MGVIKPYLYVCYILYTVYIMIKELRNTLFIQYRYNLRSVVPQMSLGYSGRFHRYCSTGYRVYTAYKDAPDIYGNISDEVAGLQVLIDRVLL